MKRLAWTLRGSQIDLSLAGFPECFVLVPECGAEEAEAEEALAAQGVSNHMGFVKNGINGRLEFPAKLGWEADGALSLMITTNESEHLQAWFWLVEGQDGSGRRFAWWGTSRNRDDAIPWA
jgi:hypothetical protein